MSTHILESSLNKDGFKSKDDYKSNPYSLVIGKIIDMQQNYSELNRELINKLGRVISEFEAELTDDTGIWLDTNTGAYRFQRRRKTLCRANSLAAIRLKKIKWVKQNI